MTPLWLALPALVVAAAAGLAVERAALVVRPLLDRDVTTWAVRVVVGLALYVALVVHPLFGGVLAVGLVAFVRRQRREGALVEPATPRPPLVALALALVALVAVAARPAVPLGWDEAVWLSRARIACDGPWVLATRALDPTDELVPAGYPLGASALHAALACFQPDLGAITAGGAALTLIVVALLALVAAFEPGIARGPTALVLVAAPLLWVHLRSGALDLPIGALSATFALSLLGTTRGDVRHVLLAPSLACVLAATKDEGALHVIAVALSLAVLAPERAKLRRHAGLAVLVAVVTLGVWRLRIAFSGADVEHHTVAGLTLAALPDLLRELVRAATDVASFGATTAVAVAACLAAFARRRQALSAALALAVVLVVGGALAALMLGPDAVRVFALEGTVFSRLCVQVVPLGALVVGARLAERDTEEGTVAT